MSDEGLRVVRLEAENFKRLKAVEIKPDKDGNMVIVSGKNGAGKTSVLDSIWIGLTGKKPPKPIRNGENKATISLDIGDYEIVRRYTKTRDGGTRQTLELTQAGQPVKQPQTVLNELVGELTMDPLKFSLMSDKDRLQTLLDLTGLDFTKHDAERAVIYNERTLVNRDIKTLEGQVKGLKDDFDGVPDDEININDLIEETSSLNIKISKAIDAADKLTDIRKKISDMEEMIYQLRIQEKQLTATVEDARFGKYEDRYKEGRQQINAVEKLNSQVRAKHAYQDKIRELKAKQKESDQLTDRIRQLDEEKEKRIASTKMPIEGLGTDEAGVIYNGIPWEQISTSGQLRVSMAMAMAMNPKIRVILIRDGSLLDSESLSIISEMTADKGYQAWIEVVDETGKRGIHIVEGEVNHD